MDSSQHERDRPARQNESHAWPQSSQSNDNSRMKQASKDQKVSYMTLPNKRQLAILCICRIADPLASTSIQSYMFYQLKFFDPSASDAKVSSQAGLIIGARTAAQVCTGMLWGRLADSEWGGRKTVLMIGLLSIASVGYGFSTSFSAAIVFQVLRGLMNSNVAITRCVVAELNSEKRYRTRALLLLPLFGNTGVLLGPLIGGLLSHQTNDGHSYPYAPPNVCIAVVYFLAATGVFFGLKETLEMHDAERNFARRLWKKLKALLCRQSSFMHEYAPIDSNEPSTPFSPTMELPPTPLTPSTPLPPFKRKAKLPFRRIWTFNVICTMLSHFIMSSHLGTFSSLWGIFLSTPIAKGGAQHSPIKFTGGLGMLPRDVGIAMSLLGAIGVVLQMAVYPSLQDRFGTIKIWRTALFIFPVVYLIAPYPSLVASLTNSRIFTWLSMCFVLLLFGIGRAGVTPATTLLINDCTPHPSARGTINTTGTLMAHLARSIFPITALTIFGKGLDIGVVGLAFWCVTCLAILSCVASAWVREGGNGTEIVLEDEFGEVDGERRAS